MKETLIEVRNYPRSVVELYLSDNGTIIKEVKCLPDNRTKQYRWPLNTFLTRPCTTPDLKNKIALALDN